MGEEQEPPRIHAGEVSETLVPHPSYQRVHAKHKKALHIDALTLVTRLHLLTLCRLAHHCCPPPLPKGPDLLAGYGYRPGRSIFWYLVIIFGFVLTYHTFGQLALYPPDALVFSLTSFHGRGFFPGLGNEASLHNSLVMLAAIEAVVGLFIEISFIATFTKRFFGS